DSIDYPSMARAAATAVTKGFVDATVLLCDTAAGAALAANKCAGVRAAACHDAVSARQSRERLNTNVLCIGGGELQIDRALAIIREWAGTKFSDEEQHVR